VHAKEAHEQVRAVSLSRREVLHVLGLGGTATIVGAVVHDVREDELTLRWVSPSSEEYLLNAEAIRAWSREVTAQLGLHPSSIRAVLVRSDRQVVQLQLFRRTPQGKIYAEGNEAATEMRTLGLESLPQWPVDGWPT
jgi:hypothetical protein